MKDWIATALGLAGGFALAWWIAAAALPRLAERARRPELLVKLAFGGTVVALLPAVLLSIVVGRRSAARSEWRWCLLWCSLPAPLPACCSRICCARAWLPA